ncbi:paraquat-inducible protein A [Photobacterium rosenbergii]|uniref:Paraquat-inducible protein A n=1 Tax=Photobacterium rosenbergii TaxID=294936 RepID=A0ABU3ZFN9_9GAMM|nr:paraquat-inducible protein A [Photobacterium rosenbergii]MDV5168857.1 paraquat-inducible protein A [Photobacterium rosenbergii]
MTTARLCPGCDLPLLPQVAEQGQSAYCPRCNTRLYRGGHFRFSSELAIALACLILFIPAHFFPLITIRLFGVMIPATLTSGTFSLAPNFPAVALLILFCSSIAPLLVCGSVLGAQVGLRFRRIKLFRRSLWIIEHLKHWAMFDVFLVSLGISCFKVQDYADIFVGPGLYSLVLLQLLTALLLTRISINRYWEAWQPETEHKKYSHARHCHHCHMTQDDHDNCVRCDFPLHKRMPQSIQKTWAYLIAATVFIFPANLYPISIFLNNGKRVEDTIFSGVASLVNSDMLGIAIIIFIASIVVPVAKILGLAFILLNIQFKRSVNHLQRMKLYRFIQWIGKWSMMDLFVISIMVTLIDRDQLLDFTPGPGAIAFGVVVVLTMLAAESLDSRLIWDNYEQRTK